MGKQSNQNDKQLLSQRIESEIEQLIRSGEIPVGGKLPTEQQFCNQFSVSRNAIRPALKSLSARGLVKIIKGSGVYVNELDSKSVTEPLDLYFELSNTQDLMLHAIRMRQLVEPGIASVSAMKRTIGHLNKLKSNLSKMQNCPLDNIEDEAEIDRRFHSLVSEAAGNPVVNLLMEPIYKLISKYKLAIFAKSRELNTQDEKDILMKYHRDIFNAIKEKDSREAYFVMREHLRLTEKNYLRNIKLE